MAEQDHKSRFEKLAGFDPGSRPRVTEDLLKEALEEVTEERRAEAKKRFKELFTKAAELRKKMVQAEREFNSQKKKFEKELGKLMNRLENEVNGITGSDAADEEAEADQAE